MSNQPQPQALMTFIGVVRELGPSVSSMPARQLTPEERKQLQRGTLYWAGDRFLRPGLYMWTGEANILIASKTEILVKLEAQAKDPNGPKIAEEFWEGIEEKYGEEE